MDYRQASGNVIYILQRQPVGRIGADLSAVARRAKAEGVIRRFDFQSRSDECAIFSHMPNDRRAVVPGGCFFVTVNLLERKQTLLID